MFVQRRWIPAYRVEYAREAQELLHERGCVRGEVIYEKRHQARWQARGLRQLLNDCRMFDSPTLVEHTEKKWGGWVWSLEYKPRGT